MTFIYALVDPITNECRYVGKADNLRTRLRKHINGAKNTNTHKNAWIRKLLSEGYTPEIIELDVVRRDEWKYYEQWWISLMKFYGANLTNTTNGGDGSKGLLHTEATKRKLSEHALTRNINGERNPNYGNTMSEESKQRIRESRKGACASEETKRKISATIKHKYQTDAVFADKVRENNKKPKSAETLRKLTESSTGRKHTVESRQKISSALSGKVRTEEHSRRISEAKKGISTATPETRAKMSAAAKGREFSAEHKKRLSENKKAYWAAKKA